MIKQIAGQKIKITRTTHGLAITTGSQTLDLDGDEWIEMVGLILAIKAASDFAGDYDLA